MHGNQFYSLSFKLSFENERYKLIGCHAECLRNQPGHPGHMPCIFCRLAFKVPMPLTMFFLLLVAAQHASFGQPHFCYHTVMRRVALYMGQALMPESAAEGTASMSPDRYVIVCVHKYMDRYAVFVCMHVHKAITVCLCGKSQGVKAVYPSDPCTVYVTYTLHLHCVYYALLAPALCVMCTPGPCNLYITHI